jgi:hypothetical protein
MERWIAIKEIEKPGYFVSDLGRIKVIKWNKEIIKLGSLSRYGYYVICYAFKKPPLAVHRLVISNFTNKPEWSESVNHINGIKTDNRLLNLEWSTHKLNNQHAFATGLNRHFGINHSHSIDISLVHSIYELKKRGMRICDIAIHLGLLKTRVRSIYRGRDWKYEYLKYFPG